jgi:hypothetical protein
METGVCAGSDSVNNKAHPAKSRIDLMTASQLTDSASAEKPKGGARPHTLF